MKRIYRYVVLFLSLVACFGLAAQAQDEPREQHVGRVQDWTYHHIHPERRFAGCRSQPGEGRTSRPFPFGGA